MVWRVVFVVTTVVRFKLIPKKYEFFVFAFCMATFMTFIMSGVVSFINMGLVDGFLKIWAFAFGNAFLVAFPSVLIVVPIVKRLVKKLIKES